VRNGAGAGNLARVAEPFDAGEKPPSRLHVFEHRPGDWWAECGICETWRTASNPTQRRAWNEIHAHFRSDHAARERLGVVCIAWSELDGAEGYYLGYWDGGSDLMVIEEMPNTPSIDVALEWARSRADRIQVRPSWDPAHSYSAGSTPRPGMPPLTARQ